MNLNTNPNPTISITGDRLFSVEEAAMRLHIHRTGVYRLINTGQLRCATVPSIRSGRPVKRVPRSAINDYLNGLREQVSA